MPSLTEYRGKSHHEHVIKSDTSDFSDKEKILKISLRVKINTEWICVILIHEDSTPVEYLESLKGIGKGAGWNYLPEKVKLIISYYFDFQ